ncbi:MAG: terminase [Alphaproteobacteria bacterium]|nr:terminase [Alphaproteobacteria bacterium]
MRSGVAVDFGKTKFMVTMAADRCVKKKKIGIFTPEYRQGAEPWRELKGILRPIRDTFNRSEGVMLVTTGGQIDFWTLNDNDLAGRGREYHEVHIDEAAFTKKNMRDIWDKAIKPTMLTTKGSAWVYSTPNGNDPENFFFQACNDAELGFTQHHAPTANNPYVPLDELEKERKGNHPLVFRQEFLAEFVDWSGVAFFSADKLLVDGQPIIWPENVDYVYATIDSAVKAGQEHDGTAVTYWARSKHFGHPLVILDWDIVQIEGALLETWLPTVLENLEMMARICKATYGSAGTFIEDKASGTILLQQAARRGLPATAIDSKLTAVGKDERAISVSGYLYRGEIKISQRAYDKVTTFKGQTRNHLMTQVTGFRIGDKDAAKRADDLLDTFTYGIAIGLGNNEGY